MLPDNGPVKVKVFIGSSLNLSDLAESPTLIAQSAVMYIFQIIGPPLNISGIHLDELSPRVYVPLSPHVIFLRNFTHYLRTTANSE